MNARELRRYSRHLLIPEVGLAGQERLAASRALVVGAGGLGSPALQYLAAAGVGRIGDRRRRRRRRNESAAPDDLRDRRYRPQQGGSGGGAAARAQSARSARCRSRCTSIRHNARELVRCYDVVLDCTDRFPTRYLINDACFLEGRADVYGSIFRFDGQVSVFGSASGPCYRCLYPEPPPAESTPTCAEGGVLGALAGIVGTWQASEALKMLLGIGDPLVGTVDADRYARTRACAKFASIAIRSARSAASMPRSPARKRAPTRRRARRTISSRSTPVGWMRRCAMQCCWTCASRTKPCSGRLTARLRFPRPNSKSACTNSTARPLCRRVPSRREVALGGAPAARRRVFAAACTCVAGCLAYAARHSEFQFF